MNITIPQELVQPLKIAAQKLDTSIELCESSNSEDIQVLLPFDWASSHWFEFGRQAGLALQLKSSIALND
jgi:hypothetical protein